MTSRPEENWTDSQLKRLDAYGVPRCVDIHCHCLPAIDDGPASMVEALDLCRALVADGITTVVATPHQLGRYERSNTSARIRNAVVELERELERNAIPLEIVPGADVRIDERIPRLFDKDSIVTVADARCHLLLELPHELLVDMAPTIAALRERGVQTIVTHPERYRYLRGEIDLLRSWTMAGAVLQITAGSLLGDFGGQAFEQAWQLVREGHVELVATDSHDARQRPPRLTEALDRLTKEIGSTAAAAMAVENPLKVFEGVPIGHAWSLSND